MALGQPERMAVGRRKKTNGSLGLYNPPEYMDTRITDDMKKMRQAAKRPKLIDPNSVKNRMRNSMPRPGGM